MTAVKSKWLAFAILTALAGACGDSGSANNDGDNGGGATAGQTAGTNAGATGGANAGATAGDDDAGGGSNAGTTAGTTAGGSDAGSTTSGGKDGGGTNAPTGLPLASECGAQANGTPLDSSAKGGCYYFYCYQTEASLLSEATQGGKCANAKDVAIQCEGESVRTVAECAREKAAGPASLGTPEAFSAEVIKCARKNAKLADFSDGCLKCNADSAACALKPCFQQCLTGDSKECDACRETNGCTPAFYACAGLPDPNK